VAVVVSSIHTRTAINQSARMIAPKYDLVRGAEKIVSRSIVCVRDVWIKYINFIIKIKNK
jgi:hypothetical protein